MMNLKSSTVTKIIIAVIVVIITSSAYYLTFSQKVSGSHKDYRFDINTSKNLTIDFREAEVTIDGWDKNYVEVSVENQLGEVEELDITYRDNSLILDNYKPIAAFIYRINTWLPLIQFERYHDEAGGREDDSYRNTSNVQRIEIKVPKNTSISFKAETATVKNCLVKASNAGNVWLEKCETTKGFSADGTKIQARACKISSGSVFKNQTVEVRESSIEDIILTPDNSAKKLNAQLRETKGTSVRLDAPTYNELTLEIRDSKLSKLIINSDEDSGTVVIRGGSVKNIENNSKLTVNVDREHN